jgi:hypothetical protein
MYHLTQIPTNSTPAYTISGRHEIPIKNDSPGPGAYCPEKVNPEKLHLHS